LYFEGEENPVKIFSVAPGVIEADMQTTLRAAKKKAFAKIEKFIALKNE